MSKWSKLALTTLIAITLSGSFWYHIKKVHDAEWEAGDALIAEGGHLVALHLSLSRENPNYKQLSLMRTFAEQAQDGLRKNERLIYRILPPGNYAAYQEMRDRLNVITKTKNN